MVDNTLRIIRNNIKYYRKTLNFTQETLSELSGISKDYLSEIERGKKNPSLKRLIIIAKALNIEVYKIFMPIIDLDHQL